MSAHEIQQPVYEIRCDRAGCEASFCAYRPIDQRFEDATRRLAGRDGWDTPPPYGKGSRRQTDFCPEHAEGGGS